MHLRLSIFLLSSALCAFAPHSHAISGCGNQVAGESPLLGSPTLFGVFSPLQRRLYAEIILPVLQEGNRGGLASVIADAGRSGLTLTGPDSSFEIDLVENESDVYPKRGLPESRHGREGLEGEIALLSRDAFKRTRESRGKLRSLITASASRLIQPPFLLDHELPRR